MSENESKRKLIKGPLKPGTPSLMSHKDAYSLSVFTKDEIRLERKTKDKSPKGVFSSLLGEYPCFL